MATLTTVIVLVHVVFPAGMLAVLVLLPPRSRGEIGVRIAMVGTFVVYLFLAGQWGWFSYYARSALVGAFLLACWLAVRRVPAHRVRAGGRARERIYLTIELVGLAFFVGFLARAVMGFRYDAEPLALRFPFDEGVSYVNNGGSTAALNLHAHNGAQRYGLDIVQLNAAGARASGLYPRDLESYAIYGRAVRAPCSGLVLQAVDGLPDLIPPATDPAHSAGNFVAIACGEATVVLAHFGRGTVRVAAGDRVEAGAFVGRVGNSGLTTEPHLHIHAVAGRPADPVHTGTSVPMLFDGRYLVRNSIVRR